MYQVGNVSGGEKHVKRENKEIRGRKKAQKLRRKIKGSRGKERCR